MKQQTVGYKIRFIAGELAGRTFAIPNSGTTIGRRRDADIRPGGTDIAAEHLSLMPQADSGVLMHVYDNESAWVDGNEIAGGADALLTPGEDVRIGKEGIQKVRLPIPAESFGEGIFVVRAEYRIGKTAPYCDYYRFSIMTPLKNLHPTKNIFGTLGHYDRISRGEELAGWGEPERTMPRMSLSSCEQPSSLKKETSCAAWGLKSTQSSQS